MPLLNGRDAEELLGCRWALPPTSSGVQTRCCVYSRAPSGRRCRSASEHQLADRERGAKPPDGSRRRLGGDPRIPSEGCAEERGFGQSVTGFALFFPASSVGAGSALKVAVADHVRREPPEDEADEHDDRLDADPEAASVPAEKRGGSRMTDRPPYRDAVVLLTANVSAERMDEIKRQTAVLSKQAVRDALGKPRQSDPPADHD